MSAPELCSICGHDIQGIDPSDNECEVPDCPLSMSAYSKTEASEPNHEPEPELWNYYIRHSRAGRETQQLALLLDCYQRLLRIEVEVAEIAKLLGKNGDEPEPGYLA